MGNKETKDDNVGQSSFLITSGHPASNTPFNGFGQPQVAQPKRVEPVAEQRDSYSTVLDSVDKGLKGAKTKLAWYLLSGLDGAQIDPERAVAILEEQVLENDSEAMWMLGMCREYGVGTKKDLQEAKNFYQRSSDNGNTVGRHLRANCFDGRGTSHMFLEGLSCHLC